jgi:hypothetical protein
VDRIALHLGDDQQIHIAIFPRRALGVGAEEHYAFRSECANEPVKGALNQGR